MVHSVTQFISITSIVNTCVYLPNGEQALVTHVGTVHISLTLVLTDVLCVPSFGFSLISVSKLTQNLFCCLIFLGHCCFLQDLAQWSMVDQGRESNGLYLLDSSSQQSSSTLIAATNPLSSIALWHTRLGYLSFSKLQLLKNVVNIDVSNKASCCDVCHFSKQKGFLFPLVIMHLLPLLNWFIVTFGVLLLLALLNITNTFLLLWMIFQATLGFISSNLNQILRFYFQVLLIWLKLNLIATLRPLEVIMVHNFTLKTSFTPMVSCTNYLVLILLNKMSLLRGSINIYFMLLEH